MTKKNKYITLAFIGWFLGVGLANAYAGNPFSGFFYGIALGGYIMLYIYENYKNIRTSVPDVYIKTDNYMGLTFVIPQYEAAGYRQTAYWCTWKYFIFGPKTYHVEMNRPEDFKEPEPTDDELIKQERFEELAERQKKRENNK